MLTKYKRLLLLKNLQSSQGTLCLYELRILTVLFGRKLQGMIDPGIIESFLED